MKARSARWAAMISGAIMLIALPMRSSAAQDWPRTRSFSKVFDFPHAEQAELTVRLEGEEGRVLYVLECHNWLFEKDPSFDYSGDFECRLIPLYEKSMFSTLLTDDPHPTADWQSRGRFLIPELLGKCATYPEYGRVRNFQLRSMRVRLELSNMVFRASAPTASRVGRGLASFRLAVSVQPDPNALSPIAQPPAVPAPPDDCGPGYRSPSPGR